jgi:effector-binding domain-containing protein
LPTAPKDRHARESSAANFSHARHVLEKTINRETGGEPMTEMMLNSMIEKPTVIETTPLLLAKLYAKVPTSEIRNQMGLLVRELSEEMRSQGIAPTGPWFTHHLRGPDEFFDFEVCFPVATPIKASGRVEPGEWPRMKMVRTVYHGTYEGLHAGWRDFTAEIKSLNLRVSPEIWEVYRIGPEAESNPEKWQTELSRAIL